ncbi:MAG: DUF4129 domain-containing protein [Caldilineaceae bacterium]|nr:DUF4129 domain-containing protein [Caldilineaceae bacterium]HRJ43271.1 DUF4129 domain-containing protein [Caldilineaceae bacterium]
MSLRRFVFLCSLFSLLLLLWGGGLAGAQDEPISLADYRARLAGLLERIESGRENAPPKTISPPVRLLSGETVLPAPLFGPDDGDAVAVRRLAVALEQMDLSRGDDTAARMAQLEAVAARLDLLQPTLWERFIRWFWEWVERLLPRRSPVAGGALGQVTSTLIGWAIFVSGGLLLVLLLGYWLRRLLAGMLAGQESGDAEAGADGWPVSAAQARQQAGQMAQAGNYREAVRRLYLAALLRLAEREVIRYDPSQTNREVLERVDPNAPTHGHLQPVVETFDRVWYGEREPDEETFRVYSREIDALLSERREGQRG